MQVLYLLPYKNTEVKKLNFIPLILMLETGEIKPEIDMKLTVQ